MLPEKAKNNALGELRFLKAWSEFELVQSFWWYYLCLNTSIGEGNSMYTSPELPSRKCMRTLLSQFKGG